MATASEPSLGQPRCQSLSSRTSVSGDATSFLDAEGTFAIDESELSYYDFSVCDYNEYLNVRTDDRSQLSSVVMTLKSNPTVTPKPPEMLDSRKDPWMGRATSSTSSTSGYQTSDDESTSETSGEDLEETPPSSKPAAVVLVQEVNSSRYYYMTSSGEVCRPAELKEPSQPVKTTSHTNFPKLPNSKEGAASIMPNSEIQKIGAQFDALVKSTVGGLSLPIVTKPSRLQAHPPPAVQSKTGFPCPHCDLFKDNGDPNMLRLHIYTHYISFWNGKVPKYSKDRFICFKHATNTVLTRFKHVFNTFSFF